MMRLLPFLVVASVTAACADVPPDHDADRAAILALHAEAGQAHLDRDPARFLSAVDSGWWAASNVTWAYRSRDAALEGLTAYFGQTTFEAVTDLAPPDVHISPDGTVAWLRGEVEIRASQVDAAGRSQPLHFRAAWLDIYEKRAGRWRLVARPNTQRDVT